MRLPLDMDTLRAFSDEFYKISMDAGARACLAGKTGKGHEYFPGGELPSNSPTQVMEAKLGSKWDEFVDKAQEPVTTGLKGAGGGILVGQLLTGGGLGGGRSGLARLGYRGFGALGAGAALAAQHHYKSKATLPEVDAQKTAGVTSSATFTPARQLSAGVQTGSFEHVVHNEGAKLHPPKVGQKFNFPSQPQ